MTTSVSENRIWTAIRDGLTALAALIVIASAISAVGFWLTGGLRPQNQVDIDNLTKHVADNQADMAKRVGDVQTDVSSIKKRIDEQPRPIDWAAMASHIAAHDQQFHDVDTRQTRDEIDAADVKARVVRLESGTQAPVRNPR